VCDTVKGVFKCVTQLRVGFQVCDTVKGLFKCVTQLRVGSSV